MNLETDVRTAIALSDAVCNEEVERHAEEFARLNDEELFAVVRRMFLDCNAARLSADEALEAAGENATRNDRLKVGIAVMAEVGACLIGSALLAKRFGGAQ